MRKNSKENIYVILILIILFGVSVGYAILTKTLNVTGSSEVKQNTWDIHFENIQIKKGSVTATKEPTIENSNTSVNFSFMLDLPGDYYEFTVDAVNSGTIDAMIESITKTPELTTDQAKYLNYIIEYQNGEQISSKQLVEKDSFVRIKVRVEYRTDILESDMPTTMQYLDLGFTLNYVQSGSKATVVKNHGIVGANGDINEIGTIVTIGSEQFYTIGTEGENVKLLSMYNLYIGNECEAANSCIVYGDETTGRQESNMKGYVSKQLPRKGTTVFSSALQKGTNYSDYNGSIVEEYVNNYKIILEEDYGINIVEARLITVEELTNEDIGCSTSTKSCANAPNFIYSTSYWTGSASENYFTWIVYSYSTFDLGYCLNEDSLGVRPVIIISKSLF